jgi:Putative citrate transport
MLFIRPWIRANKYRYTGFAHGVLHLPRDNLGGGLTLMGPPLFLGYLKGVPFWWMIQRCWLAWSVALLSLLLIFYLVDRHNFHRAPVVKKKPLLARSTSRDCGTFSFSRSFSARFSSSVRHFSAKQLCSRLLPDRISQHQKVCIRPMNFRLPPAKEVGWLFLRVFITMVPVLDYMELHARDLAIDTPAKFYWITALCPRCSTMRQLT